MAMNRTSPDASQSSSSATVANNGNGDAIAAAAAAASVATASTAESPTIANGQIQHYCLKWNDHQDNLCSVFSRLFLTEQFTDVLVAVDGKVIRAHKLVLSACSSYFESLFATFDERNQIVILKDTDYDDAAALIEFMYKGEINVPQEQLGNLLRTAENLQIKGLADIDASDDEKACEVQIEMDSVGGGGSANRCGSHNSSDDGESHSTPENECTDRSDPSSKIASLASRMEPNIEIRNMSSILPDTTLPQLTSTLWSLANNPGLLTNASKKGTSNIAQDIVRSLSTVMHSPGNSFSDQRLLERSANFSSLASRLKTAELNDSTSSKRKRGRPRASDFPSLAHFSKSKKLSRISGSGGGSSLPYDLTQMNRPDDMARCAQQLVSVSNMLLKEGLTDSRLTMDNMSQQFRSPSGANNLASTSVDQQNKYDPDVEEAEDVLVINDAVPTDSDAIQSNADPSDYLKDQGQGPKSDDELIMPQYTSSPVTMANSTSTLSSSRSQAASDFCTVDEVFGCFQGGGSSNLPRFVSTLAGGQSSMLNLNASSASGTPSTKALNEFSIRHGVIKMSEYLMTGTRQQFWDENFVKIIMQAVKEKELDMKGGAEILGVSYGTLYGRYREVYGYLKHGWNGPSTSSSSASATSGPTTTTALTSSPVKSIDSSLAIGSSINSLHLHGGPSLISSAAHPGTSSVTNGSEAPISAAFSAGPFPAPCNEEAVSKAQEQYVFEQLREGKISLKQAGIMLGLNPDLLEAYVQDATNQLATSNAGSSSHESNEETDYESTSQQVDTSQAQSDDVGAVHASEVELPVEQPESAFCSTDAASDSGSIVDDEPDGTGTSEESSISAVNRPHSTSVIIDGHTSANQTSSSFLNAMNVDGAFVPSTSS